MILTEDELVRWGEAIGRGARTPLFLGLQGPLGAGKSVLARAVARGAGVERAMPSPTFNLVFRYRVRPGVQVVHLDLYRITSPDELWELGWGELGAPDEIALVEWPERAGAYLPADRWEVELSFTGEDPELRRLVMRRWGEPSPLPAYPMRRGGRESGS